MMHIAHHPIFVTLSMIIACLGSWTALDLFRRVRAHVGTWRGAWLLAASVAMGLSIWAMHFIAMLGFNPGAEVRYRIGLTLLSLLLAIVVTALAFFFSAARGDSRRLVLSGLGMGTGICTMHYVGMAAVISPFRIENEPVYVVLAFVVAVTASTGALIAAMRERSFLERAFAAIVLGFAIVGMHYTAMFGVRLSPSETFVAGQGGIDSVVLAFGIAGGTFFILFLALIAALSDRRFEAVAALESSRSEQRMRAIIEHMPLGVFVAARPSGEIQFANAEASRLLGHAVDTGSSWSQIRMESAVERWAVGEEDVLGEAVKTGRRAGPWLQSWRRRDGSIIQIEVTVAPLSDRGPGSGLVVVALQDVTEKLRAERERQAQEDLRRLNELLEERVAAALAEKEQAQAALLHGQRLESLGRLTGGVAHDFNNLLTVVIGALDIILRHPDNVDRRTRLGEAALAAAKRGHRLTAQLLAFARQQPLHPEPCDLNELIRVGEPLIRRAVGEKLTFTLALSREPVFALIDPAQFEASLLNLVVNAVDACGENGRIAIETSLCERVPDADPATADPNATGRYFCLSIADTGHGMSADVLSRVFDPFFTTKAPGKGTGLGLSQVYGFLKQSGGEVRVQSTQGQGTTFHIYVPAIERGASAVPELRVAKPTSRPMTILLTEDDAAVAVIAREMLRNLGHEVVLAENGEQALEILRSSQPLDVLVSDIVMPGRVNGVELAQQAVVLRPGLQVLLSSGYAGESVDHALTQRHWPFLRKPYMEDELAEHMERFARQAQEGVALR